MFFEDLNTIASCKYTIRGLSQDLGMPEEKIRQIIKEYGIPYHPPKYKKWTKQDDELILSMKKEGKPNYKIAYELDRNVKQIEVRISKLGIGKQTLGKWSEEDDKHLLFMLKQGIKFADIGLILNRTKNACKARYIKIKKGVENNGVIR